MNDVVRGHVGRGKTPKTSVGDTLFDRLDLARPKFAWTPPRRAPGLFTGSSYKRKREWRKAIIGLSITIVRCHAACGASRNAAVESLFFFPFFAFFFLSNFVMK
jgi:hypothetical protein